MLLWEIPIEMPDFLSGGSKARWSIPYKPLSAQTGGGFGAFGPGVDIEQALRLDDLEDPMSGETDQTQFILKDVGDTLHERLHVVCRHLPTDFEPYGKRVRTAADCSCGCQHFLKLLEPLGFDWGVCINPRSPRSGLLTFEHQGCEFFEVEPDTGVTSHAP